VFVRNSDGRTILWLGDVSAPSRCYGLRSFVCTTPRAVLVRTTSMGPLPCVHCCIPKQVYCETPTAPTISRRINAKNCIQYVRKNAAAGSMSTMLSTAPAGEMNSLSRRLTRPQRILPR